jgi:hypothetical protein
MNRFFRPTFLALTATLIFCFTITGMASATTYYIAANGSDSNNGTSKTTPWLHAPGMPSCSSSCASASPKPGDQIIFRGGDTWHFGNSSASPYVGSGGWVWTKSGTSGNPIYIGVDQTWYSGGSWVRPVLSGDNSLWSGSGFPSSCSYPESGAQVSLSPGGTLSYVTFDNFEFSGFCWTGQSSSNGGMLNVPGGDTNLIVSNEYCHGWTMTSGASDNFPCFQSFGAGTVADLNQYVGIVVDGSDSPHFPAGSPNCQWFSNDPAGCASGQGMNGSHFYDVHESVFRYVSNIMVTGNCHTIHDNLFEYLYDTFASGSLQQHPNVMNCLGGASGDPLYWYNNLMRNTFSTENVYFAVRTNLYFFNNVMYNNMNSTVGSVPGGCIRLNAAPNAASIQTASIYNNTFGDATCLLQLAPNNSPLNYFTGTVNWENNHFIGGAASTLGNWYQIDTNGSNGCQAVCTITDNGNELYQTETAANAQGYKTTNNYAPTLNTNSTVGAGATNSTTVCSTFSSDSELCSGTSDGPSEQGGGGGELASYPAISLVQRVSSWDIGAYQFSGTTAPNPPTGLSAVVQ